MSSQLAIKGGIPVRQGLFPSQITIGEEEERAVLSVMKKKLLSGYRGNSSSAFMGGEQVQKFEVAFIEAFRMPTHQAVAVNSCTSALQIACGAIGLQPGDEVIVTPWSMSCSATAPLIYGAVPVFADIEHDYFCLDPKSVREKITDKTKAIIVVDLFGQPFDPEILDIAKEYNLVVIEDAAQAIGSSFEGPFPAGFLGDIGCFSFTQGKHLTSGEGGIAVSANPRYIRNMQLIRNHAEAVISDMDNNMFENELNMVGFNMRMTEIQATILNEQLKKAYIIISNRIRNAHHLQNALSDIPAIRSAPRREGASHSYYVQAFFWDKELADGLDRDTFIQAVKAELQPQEGRIDLGVPISCGYIKPLYRMPLFRDRMHWALKNKKDIVVPEAWPIDFPVVEKLWKEELFLTTIIGLALDDQDRDDISNAFHKVWNFRKELK
jgi:dTDP-4-amino-4,6-dideoxygalactose transaminase